jgi:hypothetical protein
MSNRDEFSLKTKQAVALRANQHCSFRGCPQATSGPSDESPEAVNMTGKAAHIHGAAPGPGSRRYTSLLLARSSLHSAGRVGKGILAGGISIKVF